MKDVWKILNNECTLKEAAEILGLVIPDDTTLKAAWMTLTMSYKFIAYNKLVESGEIDREIIYNLGTINQSEPRDGDMGIRENDTFIFRNGNWA